MVSLQGEDPALDTTKRPDTGTKKKLNHIILENTIPLTKTFIPDSADYPCCLREKTMESHKLYVGNISHSVTEEELRDVFSGFGQLTEVKIIRDRGFGFVSYATLEEAEEARKTMAGKEFEGRPLRVEDAHPIYQSAR